MDKYFIVVYNTKNEVIYNGNINLLTNDYFDNKELSIVEVKREFESNHLYPNIETMMVFFNKSYLKLEELKGINFNYKLLVSDKKLFDYTNVNNIKDLDEKSLHELLSFLTPIKTKVK